MGKILIAVCVVIGLVAATLYVSPTPEPTGTVRTESSADAVAACKAFTTHYLHARFDDAHVSKHGRFYNVGLAGSAYNPLSRSTAHLFSCRLLYTKDGWLVINSSWD
jgi:hypothetical protein